MRIFFTSRPVSAAGETMGRATVMTASHLADSAKDAGRANRTGYVRGHAMKQRGLVLFFALIALVVMSLAAVALIRSVDTGTLIAGNLAFKQSATSAADYGVETAIAWMTKSENDMQAAKTSVYNDVTHVFNTDSKTLGYYSNADPALDLTNSATWVNANSQLVVNDDGSGNEIRYIIQRMCRDPNQPLNIPNNCLYSSPAVDKNEHTTPLPSTICTPPPAPIKNGCPLAGQAPQYRITSRARGPSNTISYVQAFVF